MQLSPLKTTKWTYLSDWQLLSQENEHFSKLSRVILETGWKTSTDSPLVSESLSCKYYNSNNPTRDNKCQICKWVMRITTGCPQILFTVFLNKS